MWLEDPTTKLEKAAYAAWPGVLEEAQLPIVGWSYVLLFETRRQRLGPHFIFGRAAQGMGCSNIGYNCGPAHRPPLPHIFCDWRKRLASFNGPKASLL
jgi:hypothetical protein